jgi:diguanylate cyclase (GGDEF)-like protein
VIRRSEFSLRRLSVSSLVWYAATVCGWLLIAVAAAHIALSPHVEMAPAFVMTAAMVIVLELLPLVQGRGHDPQGIVMSTAFVCAMLFMWGLWPAVLSVAIASLASDLRAGKVWWKVAFNPAQYALSVGAGWIFVHLGTDAVTLSHPLTSMGLRDLPWIIGAWVAYFVVNLVLVAGVLSWNQNFFEMLFDDFWNYARMEFAVKALSPVIVLVSERAWALLPLLIVPLLLLYHTAAMSLEREHQAGHDALTGLANRVTLQFELSNALATYQRSDEPFALMLIDLDDFKLVNDTLGHQAGDTLLVRFADRLRHSVRPEDLVARLGGDEFAVIVYAADEPSATEIGTRLARSLTDTIDLSGVNVAVEASVGIAVCPTHGTDATSLLRSADVAMYAAKETRTRIAVYSEATDSNSTDQLGMLSDLRTAVLENKLELHYQPKVTACDGKPLGVEALLRWPHPVRGYVPPDEFIMLAERSGIMPMLTARVVELALEQVARWRDDGLLVPVAVNIAPTDLLGDGLIEVVADALRRHELPAGLLQLEITERIVTHHLESAKATLRRLRDMGITISLDDFGTGYSSLMRLSTLHVDEIKIDRGFVSAMAEGDRGLGIVRALIDLAHALGLPAIAEGVETSAEMGQLRSLGCDGVQGWHIARPMPAAEATEWLRAHREGPLPDDTMLALEARADTFAANAPAV